MALWLLQIKSQNTIEIFDFSSWRGDTLAAINKSKSKLSFHIYVGVHFRILRRKDLPGISVLK